MPTTIYQLRDQHLGVLPGHVWVSEPSAAQLAPVLATLGNRDLVANAQEANEHTLRQLEAGDVTHGHGWCFVVESTLYGDGESHVAAVVDEDEVTALERQLAEARARKGVSGTSTLMTASGVGKVG